jgi:hypothetical protein
MVRAPGTIEEIAMPQALLVILGAAGAVLLGKWLAKEAQRVNSELDRVKAAMAESPSERPTLRRDPQSGVYRPQ